MRSVVSSSSPSSEDVSSVTLAQLEARRVNELIKTTESTEDMPQESVSSFSVDAKRDIDARESKMVESFRRFEKDAEKTIEAILSLEPTESPVVVEEEKGSSSSNSDDSVGDLPQVQEESSKKGRRPSRRYITFLRTLNDHDDEIEERNEKGSLVTRQELYTVALSTLVVMFLMSIGVVYFVQSEGEKMNTQLYDAFACHNASLERACDYSATLMQNPGYHPVYATTGGAARPSSGAYYRLY
mmetsp:Transcript_5550/g.5450  ORF Transcript_5550/g.5450 Transcript_5550/m.5450 type:complete len:242 (+) Transcript_5550:50-775(+)